MRRGLSLQDIVLFHVPFRLGYRESGGGIRPGKLIAAYEKLGISVRIISGSHRERHEQFQSLWSEINAGKVRVRYVYSESFSGPAVVSDKRGWWYFRDYWHLTRLRLKGVRVGLFYRDVHWRFGIDVKGLSKAKYAFLKLLHLWDLACYLFFVDHLFLPSLEMAKHVPLASFFGHSELPPGHDVHELLTERTDAALSGVYVGGVTNQVYDVTPLMDLKTNLSLTICCRQDEWLKHQSYYQRSVMPQIVHLSGAALSGLLRQTHISVMVRKPHAYLDFSQPLKFYEAIGFEMPILVSEGSKVADQVKEWGIGWVIKTNDAIQISHADYVEKWQKIRALKSQHTWEKRVESIEEVLGA
jgi:hypothetical protein